MGARRVLYRVAGALALTPVVCSALLAVLATRPRLAAKVFGPGDQQPVDPADLGLPATDIEYDGGSRAWWIPAVAPVGSVVIVHGYEPTDDPRSTDPAPRLEVAAMLRGHGLGTLVINLGYASGSHPHSGGELEARDVARAVEWVRAEVGLPVALFGFSAGGHACVLAAKRSRPFAVVTDGTFVDFGEVVVAQGSEVLRLPRGFFGLVPVLMRLLTGHRPIDLGDRVDDLVDGDVAMLHIHGSADEAIDHDNLNRLAAITGGRTLSIPGAGHLEGFRADPATYEAAVIELLVESLGPSR